MVPPLLVRAPSRRDALLILIGAFLMNFFTLLTSHSIARPAEFYDGPVVNEHSSQDSHDLSGLPASISSEPSGESGRHNSNTDMSRLAELPETTIVEHVPGWTLFRDIYMANGTLLILSSDPSSFPETRYMTSTGLPADASAENAALREPTPSNMDIISPKEALRRWGNHPSSHRVWSVQGNTLLFNDPPQFLNHYYHFCAELLLGAWSIWIGATHPEPPPPIHRAIFPHSSSMGWRDKPGFNGYFINAAFPSLTTEVDDDWNDRVAATSASIDSGVHRAWHFPYLLLADRSAAFRGKLCGSQNQRTASESVDVLVARSKLDGFGLWWRPVKLAVWGFAGITVDRDDNTSLNLAQDNKPLPSSTPNFEETEKIVITYISRQGSRRRLIPEDHGVLVKGLEDLVQKKNVEIASRIGVGGIADKEWELNVVKAESLTKDKQVQLAARTTILLGVHGNGLSHLILMPRTNVSAVIEIFYPDGFAHDYEWTARALGMGYFGVWNHTYFTGENTPKVNYPEGFQGEKIPVYGPNVANIIEKRIAGEL